MIKCQIKTGQTVKVVRGKFRGHSGKVTRVVRREAGASLVFVEGVVCKKTVKANPNQNEEGGIKDMPKAIAISNVILANDSTNKVAKKTKSDKE